MLVDLRCRGILGLLVFWAVKGFGLELGFGMGTFWGEEGIRGQGPSKVLSRLILWIEA